MSAVGVSGTEKTGTKLREGILLEFEDTEGGVVSLDSFSPSNVVNQNCI